MVASPMLLVPFIAVRLDATVESHLVVVRLLSTLAAVPK